MSKLDLRRSLYPYWNVKFLVSNALIPIIALAAYFGSFALISTKWLMEGINYIFTYRTFQYLSILLLVLSLIVIFLKVLKKDAARAYQPSIEKMQPSDAVLLLLPLTPVVQYVLNNQVNLSFFDALLTIFFFIVFSSVYLFVIPWVLRKVGSTRILQALGLSFVYTILSMASLSQQFAWLTYGSLKIQLPYFGVAFLLLWVLLDPRNRKILILTVSVYFVINSSMQFISNGSQVEQPSVSDVEKRLSAMIANRSPVYAPNIYLLVYDSYVPNETMLAYGIDNSAQETYLTEQGFVLYPHIYSVGATSVDTMGRIFDISKKLPSPYRKSVSGDGPVQHVLKDLGYKTYGILPTDYMFRGIGSSYDVSVPQSAFPQFMYLINAVLIGEFKFDLEFSDLTPDEFNRIKKSLIEEMSGNKAFLYTHLNLPNHSQNSGTCLPNETELFKGRLLQANQKMQEDVQNILSADPEALIIVAGDHGPSLTKTCTRTDKAYDLSEITRLDIQDRYGTFLAIRWPSIDYQDYDEIMVIQDLFPAIFGYLYQDASLLDLRIDPSTKERNITSGAFVENGIIVGGINDGEPLYLSDR